MSLQHVTLKIFPNENTKINTASFKISQRSAPPNYIAKEESLKFFKTILSNLKTEFIIVSKF
jgi:hypothetical protein